MLRLALQNQNRYGYRYKHLYNTMDLKNDYVLNPKLKNRRCLQKMNNFTIYIYNDVSCGIQGLNKQFEVIYYISISFSKTKLTHIIRCACMFVCVCM